MNSDAAAIQIESVQGPVFVQDGGRDGSMHQAIPPGGALVPELLAAAQCALGHRWNEEALEIVGGLAIRALHDLRVSLDGEVHTLATNDVLRIQPSPRARVRYLAVEGGLDVPFVLGGRGTLASVGIGGYAGRMLRRGDVLRTRGLAASAARRLDLDAWLDDESPIRIVPGPDLGRFTSAALETLTRGPYAITPESDRIGARLDGAPLPRTDTDEGGSRPMVRGAIEVPAQGRPIVLGPDHPTTGGYPVIAVVVRADQGRFRVRRGRETRFVEISVDEARAAWSDHAARWFNDVP